MLSFIASIFGGIKSKRDLRQMQPLLQQINTYYEALKSLSNNALRAKTAEFRARIAQFLAPITDKQNKLVAELAREENLEKQERLLQEQESLRKEKNQSLEKVLLEILPEAFAVVKEVARRFSENSELELNATDFDRQYLAGKEYARIQGDKVIFRNRWKVAGNEIVWNMVHYDVQLMGGIVLHQGKISEIATGEGKTLVSTLPAYLNALSAEGVHMVTVNDYLAKRDAEWNAPIFEFLGISVDCIDRYQAHSEKRRRAYEADITYGTNNEFGFDYLRDNMVGHANERVQRKFPHYAIIDEVDSVLIDDARTPLIISGPTSKDESREKFKQMRGYIAELVEVQKRFLLDTLVSAKKHIAEGKDGHKDGGLELYRVYRGLPKLDPLIKYLSEPTIKAKLHKVENQFLADNQKEMRTVVDKELYFYIEEKNNSVNLTDKGLDYLTQRIGDKHFFTLPDLSIALNEIDQQGGSEAERMEAKERVINEYEQKADHIHTMQQLLKAYTLFDRDVEYVVVNNQVKIVDEQTGRVMEGRRYSDGLHQALEAKENVQIEGASQTYATVTLQNYFRMYHKLSGMTGTAETEATELWQIYKLDVVAIPTNLPVIRKDFQDLVFKTKREKYKAVIEEIVKLSGQGRPVLVGTTSVEVSELLSRMLKQRQVAHNVLNAKQHMREAQIVAEAGLSGTVTIATNMAGRGTDIRLSDEVKALGGLAILGVERHESRRVDRQLRGRSGRQGDPGTSQFFVSLEDNLMRMFGSERIASLMDKMGYKEGEVIQHSMVTRSIERAQKKVEENNFGIRKHLLEYDDVMNKQRHIIYKKRMSALFGDTLALDLDIAFYACAQSVLQYFLQYRDQERATLELYSLFGSGLVVNWDKVQESNLAEQTQNLYTQVIQSYANRRKEQSEYFLKVFNHLRKEHQDLPNHITVPFEDSKKVLYVQVEVDKILETSGRALFDSLEKDVTLHLLDEDWKEHLKVMDDLRQSVQNAVYEQKDPLVIYKTEAFHLFSALNEENNRRIVAFLMHAKLAEGGASTASENSEVFDRKESHYTHGDEEGTVVEEKPQPITRAPKIGRNEPCPCGSGLKYKNCHGSERK